MIRRCRQAGLPEPEFKLTDGFVTVIRRPAPAGKRDAIDPATKSGPGQDQVSDPAQLESRLESRLESALAAKVLLILRQEALGKAAIAPELGHKTVSGELHKQVKRLMTAGLIEMTLPQKPNSRLQKYRLTESSRAMLAQIEEEGGKAG